MESKEVQGCTVIAGEQNVRNVRLYVLRSRMKLEMNPKLKGLRFRGGSTFTQVKREFGLKGSKEQIFAAFDKIVAQMEESVGIVR